MPLPLTLTASECSLNGITLYEPIDVAVLDKLLTSDLLKTSFHNPTAETLYKTERDQLKQYKKLIRNGKAEITYNRPKGMTFGRCNPDKALGLFSIRREIRHTLAKNTFVDVDIENAHPSMLYQICKSNGIECDNLEHYVNNRDATLQTVMTAYSVSRDQAKKLFIILLFFGSFEKWALDCGITVEPSRDIKNFTKEIQTIGKTIFDHNKAIFSLIKRRKVEQKAKDFNEIGSTVSYFLQELECRILESVYTYCVGNHLIENKIAVLCADGLMIVKDKYRPELLTIFADMVKERFGFALRFTCKEMNQDFLSILDAHQLTESQILAETMGDYNTALAVNEEEDFSVGKLSELFFQDVELLGPEIYVEEFHNTKSFKYFNAYHAHFYIHNQIHKLYKNQITAYSDFSTTFGPLHLMVESEDGRKRRMDFTKLYNDCRHKRCFSTFEFQPDNKIKTDKYNLFQGFPYETEDNTSYDPTIIQPVLDHILYICNSHKLAYEYLLNWLAHIIQKPHVKTKVAIVLYSVVEGVGKNLLTEMFEALIEGYTAKFRDTSAITDRFNGEMMGKLFVVGDEINARATEVANELKDIITRFEENVEFKGKDKIKIRDYKNYFFTTNNENIFKVSNSERRYEFIECPEEKKATAYYEALYAFKEDKAKLKHLFNFFKSRDITTFRPSEIVMTEYKERLILNNLPAYIKFIKEKYDYISGKSIPTSELFSDSVEFARANRLTSTYTERFFIIHFKKVFGDYQKLNGQRQSCYFFPEDGKDEVFECIKKNYVENP